MAMIESKVEEKTNVNHVNREKTCPLLLRVFCSNGKHSPLMDYHRGKTPSSELQIYTWKDATLKELSKLILDVNPDARDHGTVLEFSLVFLDMAKRMHRTRDLGSVIIGQKGFDDNRTLASYDFMIGDFLDVAIAHPNIRPRQPIRRMVRQNY